MTGNGGSPPENVRLLVLLTRSISSRSSLTRSKLVTSCTSARPRSSWSAVSPSSASCDGPSGNTMPSPTNDTGRLESGGNRNRKQWVGMWQVDTGCVGTRVGRHCVSLCRCGSVCCCGSVCARARVDANRATDQQPRPPHQGRCGGKKTTTMCESGVGCHCPGSLYTARPRSTGNASGSAGPEQLGEEPGLTVRGVETSALEAQLGTEPGLTVTERATPPPSTHAPHPSIYPSTQSGVLVRSRGTSPRQGSL